MRRLCGLILTAGWLTLAHAGDPAVEQMREQGLREYVNGHYAAAVIDFENAAKAGDPRSAEILALMYRFGARFYGDQVTADPAKSAYFAAKASDQRPLSATSAASVRR